MYRILIIDDEPIIREGISTTIDWNAHGFELVGACRDGREGISALQRLSPDVVLTDICMPFVDGLELASWISEEHPNIRTLLLTGHDEFEYAQEAVRLHVQDFLLKPITADELRSALDSLRGELDAEQEQIEQLGRLKAQISESLPLLRERFLNRIVQGLVSNDESARKKALLEIAPIGSSFVAVVCDQDFQHDNNELTSLAVTEIVETVVGENAIVFSTTDNESVALVTGSSPEETAGKALDYAEEVSNRVSHDLHRSVSIGIGDPVSPFEAVARSYRQAKAALERRLVLGSDHILTAEEAWGGNSDPGTPDDEVYREQYVRAIRTGNGSVAVEALHGIFDQFRSNAVSRDVCLVAVQRLLSDALNALHSLGIAYQEIPILHSNPFERLSSIKTFEQMERWFLDLETNTRKLLESRRDEHSRRKAAAAAEYIQSHFRESDLSLSRVCSALSVSKSYLSPVFKSYTGMTFVEYVTKARMDGARELLATQDLKTYEVAAEVGFRDAHYFSVTFKKQTGLSPTEYRSQILEGAE